ncbi:NTPase KAP family P-loop domain-containing protein 1 isoform X1 [Oncorhynchus kisutch]|uniref:NTPase KAP family P-loop domain-containing protein 1 isoform X1 n=1 Tax=Oncorhynchus kisutch TaxID=8019 RepID=UPI0012DD71D4|nr:NTPase KAP family P-loop domain-containing protein 1 isoform X1 [Oncorhynchus kisutch]
MITKDLLSDHIYAYALSKTLIKVSSPATVGLYSSCQNRINMILRYIEVHMEQEAERRERSYQGRSKPRSVKASITGLLALICRLLFYRPVWTEENQRRKNVRFIYVRFSAWHFAGSDLLWAGLVMRLCLALQESFGKLQLGLYRVAQHNEEDEVKKKVIENTSSEWRSKKFCCFPLWSLVLAVLLAALIVLVFLVKYGFPEVPDAPELDGLGSGNGTGGEEGPSEAQRGAGVLEGLAFAVFGLPAAAAMRFIFQMGKNLIFNQDLNVRKALDNERVSGQLGFMNEVRKEMWLLSRFILFMEVFEQRRIRVVLEITNLDRCAPKKIVGVLDAISILLSDEESPFISLLAVNPEVLVQQVHIVLSVNPEVLVQQLHIVLSVNPEVLVQQVNYADGCFSKEDRAYAFLNRIVTLAFTIPPLCHTSKHKVFYNIVSGQSEITEEAKGHGSKGIELRELDLGSPKSSLSWIESTPQTKETSSILTEASIPLIDNNHIKEAHVAFDLSEDEVDKAIESALESILSSNRGNLHHYISDDTMSMRRVINSIRVTVVLMEALKTELPPPENIAAWVVLANHWPCRLSWILQCLEDEQQRAEIDDAVGAATVVDESKALWEVFSDSRMELHMMREEIEDLLEQDGDPEMFEMFLKVHFQFRVRDAERFKLTTVNLDHSIKRELARIRGTTGLKNSGWGRNLAPLNIRTVINMTSEDVCKALARMNLPKKYADIVRSNDLTGQALVFGDPDDLKQLLQMTFGEWTTFRLHFLGIGGRAQSGAKATSLNPKPLTNQQSKQPKFGPHSHGSTLNLSFS